MIWGIVKIVVIFGLVMKIVPLLVYAERRISARIQLRLGPNMVGLPRWKILGPLGGFHLWGLLQPLADAMKFVFKENFTPARADKFLYRIAPAMVFIPAGLALAGIPFYGEWVKDVGFVGIKPAEFPLIGSWFEGVPHSGPFVIFDSELGVLFVLAASTLGVHGLSIAGWSSYNKFSQMAGVRASAQLISYEAPMFMALIAALMVAGSTDFFSIVEYQNQNMWLICYQPLAFIIFYICTFAETNRLPFDLPEAEPELVGGYHTEYGGMGFAIFFLGEYIAMIVQCAILTLVFLGGWTLPWSETAHLAWGGLAGFLIFFTKVVILLLIMIQVRWTLPRFRYDQLMQLGWKRLAPLAMINLAATAVIGVMMKS